MIGKILADRWGWTEKLGGAENVKTEHIDPKTTEDIENLKEDIKDCNTTIEIDAVVKKHGLQEIENLSQHIKELQVQGKIDNLDTNKVNDLIQTQNYTNIANAAHGFKGVKQAIDKYNEGIREGTLNTDKFVSTISSSNTNLGKYLTGLNGAKAGLGSYAVSLVTATAKTFVLQAATMALNTAVSFGISVIVSTGISLISYLINQEDELGKKTQELSEEFNNTSNEIDSYKSKIEELKQVISDSSSSYEEVTEARRDLLGIQEELIDKYGSEAEGINAITEAINGETSALDDLKKSEWYNTKKEYNKTDWQENVLYGAKQVFTNPLGLTTFFSDLFQLTGLTDEDIVSKTNTHLEDLLNKWNNQEINLPQSGNKNVDKLMSELLMSGSTDWLSGDFTKGYDGFGSVSELKEKLEQIKAYATSQNDIDENYLIKLQSVLDSLQEQYEENHQMVSDAILYDKIKSSDIGNTYDEELNKLEILKLQYDDALLEGDTEKIKQYAQNYVTALNAAMKLALNNGDKDVSDYFYNMFPTMKDVVNKNNFQNQLSTDTSLKQVSQSIKKFNENDILSFLTSKEQEVGEKAFATIRDEAIKDGIILNDSIEETKKLIDLLVEWGVLKDKAEQNATSKSTTSKQSIIEGWQSLLNPEDDALKNTREDLLELAEAGMLTAATFHETSGADTWLKTINESLPQTIKWINELVQASDQLSSMKSGISSISDVLAEKQDNLKHKKTKNVGIGADTLAGFDATIKGLDSWEEFEETLGDGKSSMEDCQKAANKLATEWVNNNNFLSQLNRTNADYYISTLKEMGVSNANQVVTEALAMTEDVLAAKKKYAKEEGEKLALQSADEISRFAEEQGYTEKLTTSLYQLALQKQTANGIKLNTTADIEQLQNLVNAISGTSTALESWKNYDGSGGTLVAQKKWQAAKNEVEKALNKSQNVNVKVDPTPVSSGSGSSNKSKKDKSNKTKSKETIDWIARRLEVLQSAIDYTKAKFENLFNFKSKQNNLAKQITQTTKLLNAQSKAAEKYQQKANSIKLSSSLKKKVQDGAITGSLSELIATYGEKTANRISKYQEYWDNYKSAKQSVQELEQSIKELQDQKDQLYVDRAEQNVSTLDAEEEIVNSAKNKNSLEQQKIKWVKQSYNYQIKIAKREKDSVKVAELRAQKEREILDIKKQILQNTLDENEAVRENAEARYQNATTVAQKNAILNEEIVSYQSDSAANNSYYNERRSDIEVNGLGTQSVPSDIKKAINESKIKESNQKKILDCIKSGKKIPDNLLNLKNVQNNPILLQKLLDYNTDIVNHQIIPLSNLLFSSN